MSAQPEWTRSVYLYAVCLAANLVMIYGGIQFALGVVNAIAPRTDANPITQIANAVVDVVEESTLQQSVPPEVRDALSSVRSGINKQARNRGVSRMVTGAVTFAAGLGAFALAWRRANEDIARPIVQPAPPPPPPPQYYSPPPS